MRKREQEREYACENSINFVLTESVLVLIILSGKDNQGFKCRWF